MQVNDLNVCKLDWEENLFDFCRVNSFQNQNTYECNFDVIIYNSSLFNIHTYLDKTQAIM